jgi:MFS superfamily sulfate permease-like transporter
MGTMTSTRHLRSDLLSGLVVFLVALPLCLGIAVASGAPPFAGILTGVIGGLVVGALSSSNVSVSGPPAGLIAITLVAITTLGYEAFLMAVVLAGAIQIALGLARAGNISSYFPTSVIEGMLAAIGIIILTKEIPHALGYHESNAASFGSVDAGGAQGGALLQIVDHAHLGASLVALTALAILIAFDRVPTLKRVKAVPGALVAVLSGIVINELLRLSGSGLAIPQEQLVSLPSTSGVQDLIGQLRGPQLSAIGDPQVWITGATIAIVASIESLLCLEAGDKMDPYRRYSSANTELRAQGVGNLVSGLLGGLPMTSVIVRTTANIEAGARTKLSAMAHGFYLLLAVLLIPGVLNRIPMASLAAVLIAIGAKLASPSVFAHVWRAGQYQFVPFLATVIAVVFTDLLKGVGIGLAVSAISILRGNMKLAYFFKREEHHEGETICIDLAQEVSFLNKAAIKQTLAHLPENSSVVIDASGTVYIDYDVLVLLRDFLERGARERNISVSLRGFRPAYKMRDSVHVHSEPGSNLSGSRVAQG